MVVNAMSYLAVSLLLSFKLLPPCPFISPPFCFLFRCYSYLTETQAWLPLLLAFQWLPTALAMKTKILNTTQKTSVGLDYPYSVTWHLPSSPLCALPWHRALPHASLLHLSACPCFYLINAYPSCTSQLNHHYLNKISVAFSIRPILFDLRPSSINMSSS